MRIKTRWLVRDALQIESQIGGLRFAYSIIGDYVGRCNRVCLRIVPDPPRVWVDCENGSSRFACISSVHAPSLIGLMEIASIVHGRSLAKFILTVRRGGVA